MRWVWSVVGLALLAACAGEVSSDKRLTARAARADFDARCAARPAREVVESNLRELTVDGAVRAVECPRPGGS